MPNTHELTSQEPENQEFSTTFLTARHTKKTKTPTEGSDESGEFYPGITAEGEKTAREKTRNEVMEVIEGSEPGSVIIFGGATDLVRTKSTTRVSGSELKTILADKPEYLVIDEQDISSLVHDRTTESTLHALEKKVAEHKDKKVIVMYPLYISELSMIKKDTGRMAGRQAWKTGGDKEEWTPYLTEVMKQAGDKEYEAVEQWVKSNGVLTAEDGTRLEGPNPLETAQEYVTALRRLEKVAKKLFPNRPLVIEATGHSWDIDVFIDYLAHKGNITPEGVREIARGSGEEPSIISDFESPVIKVGNNQATVTYRGKTYPITVNELFQT